MLGRILLLAQACLPIFAFQSAPASGDVVMRAMQDELARSMKKLQLENLQKPYFVAYHAVENENCTVTASFGAIVNSYCEPPGTARSRVFSVEVRVGDYARDNSNFFAPMMNAGVTRPLITGGLTVPLDDNYDELRRQLWLGTDSAYKTALDTFAKKKAALEHRTRTDDAPDFSKEPVVTINEMGSPIAWNRTEIESAAKALSAVFRETPGIDNSEVRWSATRWLARYVNSEGSTYVRAATLVTVNINADTQADDGMPLADYDVIYARTPAELPSRDEIAKRIRALAMRLDRMRKAALVERYTGPVLFEGQAAAEIFLQGLGSYMVGAPRVVVDDSRLDRVYNSNTGLIDRVGTRVLPDFLTVVDNPALKDVSGTPLFGGYQVDDDGVKSAPTTIVDQGVLKTLLHTRGLLPGTTHSTASHRGFSASPSNLIVTSSKSLTSEQLKAELIKMAQQRGKEYGILVRRMSNMAFASSLLRSRMIIVTGGSTPGSLSVEPLIEAYKVYPDGHEELARNLEVNGLTLGSFKDIVSVSDVPSVQTTQVRIMARQPMMAGSITPSGPSVVSIAIPSLLFEDVGLQRPSGDVPSLPFSKHPSFDK
ncbi:MAG TPA: metallopeptidase TldD-related protein [Bryobacteraceae bacterium]|nr:metallopeptidase TldD-related protein [Bryobacteraceae bacterium]